MSHKMSLINLTDLFHEFSLKLEKLDQNAVRDHNIDIPAMTKNELHLSLERKIRSSEKRLLLLSQVGYLRINLFGEYYARIKLLEERKVFDDAIELMKEYIETIAMPFILPQIQSSRTARLIAFLTGNRARKTLIENLQKWREDYAVWYKTCSLNLPVSGDSCIDKFNGLKTVFFTLYTFSFSFDNFPPVYTEYTH